MKNTHHQIIPRAVLALTLIIVTSLCTPSIHAAPLEAGPNGGKLIGTVPDQAEVLISADGSLAISFLDAEKNVLAPGTRSASVFAQTDAGRQEIKLETKGTVLVSKEPLPQPQGYTLVVQIRRAPDAKPANFRIQYDMHLCGGCKLIEYACTCTDH